VGGNASQLNPKRANATSGEVGLTDQLNQKREQMLRWAQMNTDKHRWKPVSSNMLDAGAHNLLEAARERGQNVEQRNK